MGILEHRPRHPRGPALVLMLRKRRILSISGRRIGISDIERLRAMAR